MRPFRIAASALLLSMLSLSAMRGEAQMPGFPGGPGGAGAPPPNLRDVSQAELDRYLVAMEGIIDAGFDAEKELGLDPSNAQTMAVGTQYTEKIESLLGAQGFDQQSFMDVHQNVIYAYAADMMVDAQKELEQDRARQEAAIAQLKQQMSPEQAKAVMDAMANAGAMMQSTYENVPEANKALVAKNKARIEAMFERAKQRGEASR